VFFYVNVQLINKNVKCIKHISVGNIGKEQH
jgi:hypothetical protein